MLAGVRGWFDKDMVWLAGKAGRPGRPPVFSDTAVQLCLMVNVQFGLPLRQTTGMVPSILQMAGLDWPVPDVFTLSRRQKIISVRISSGAPQPVGGQHWHQIPRRWRPLRRLLRNLLSGDKWLPASMAPIADANTARSIWRWTRPPATSGPWNSPQAGRRLLTACMQTPVGQWTAPSCRT